MAFVLLPLLILTYVFSLFHPVYSLQENLTILGLFALSNCFFYLSELES